MRLKVTGLCSRGFKRASNMRRFARRFLAARGPQPMKDGDEGVDVGAGVVEGE
jgi:hypothetical protein